MATKQEVLELLKAYVGDRTDDESIKILEVVSDYIVEDPENWKQKFEDNDREWREKYTKRFFECDKDKELESEKDELKADIDEDVSIDDLFKED